MKAYQVKMNEMGVDVDFEHNADEITTMSMPDGIAGETVAGKKRIYPNDPCPCGSGKNAAGESRSNTCRNG